VGEGGTGEKQMCERTEDENEEAVVGCREQVRENKKREHWRGQDMTGSMASIERESFCT
jgi:hypothetical protein